MVNNKVEGFILNNIDLEVRRKCHYDDGPADAGVALTTTAGLVIGGL